MLILTLLACVSAPDPGEPHERIVRPPIVIVTDVADTDTDTDSDTDADSDTDTDADSDADTDTDTDTDSDTDTDTGTNAGTMTDTGTWTDTGEITVDMLGPAAWIDAGYDWAVDIDAMTAVASPTGTTDITFVLGAPSKYWRLENGAAAELLDVAELDYPAVDACDGLRLSSTDVPANGGDPGSLPRWWCIQTSAGAVVITKVYTAGNYVLLEVYW